MNILACTLLVLDIIYLLICYIFNLKLTNKKIVLILIAIAYPIMILCLNQKPPESFDLYRYFLEMDYIRKLNFEQSIEFIFLKPNFLWFAFERLIALISKNNNVIFLFSIPITIVPFIYILTDVNKNHKLSNRQIVISIVAFFSIINTIHLMSGIRNALAISIFSIGMYMDVFKNKKIGFLFYILSLLFHPMVILVLIFRIFYKLISKIKIKIYIGKYIILFWAFFSKIVLYLLKLMLTVVPIKMLDLYVNKFNVELTLKIGADYRVMIFEFIQILLILILIYRNLKLNKNTDKRILIFYYLCFFIIGSITLFNIFTRTRFIFAYFLPYILCCSNKIKRFSRKNKRYNTIIEHILMIVTLFINIYYVYFMYCNGVFI